MTHMGLPAKASQVANKPINLLSWAGRGQPVEGLGQHQAKETLSRDRARGA